MLENKLLNSEKVKDLCKVFNVDLSILKKDVPEEDWDENSFLIDKCNFFMKEVCINRRFISLESPYEEKMYCIDVFPMAIPIEGKFPQLEIFYMPDDKYGLNPLYFQEEKKFLNVLSKLWAYSSIYLESSIFRDTELLHEMQEHEQFQSTNQLYSKESIVTIDEWKVLEYLLALSFKNQIYTCIYFTDLRIIAWIGSLRAVLYICDKEQEHFVRTICTTEGLYLRK
ncbi:cytidylyltransferase [Paenibacillus popilliae ATCC 14706]|uniref:Cytidylyltransferase n=1 Tax=Paenibacillus popilliae ATCC 14706 TaxID=1212764 RepID=M9LKP0_PAEPP|nr:cytidylyltransferase [Paenibacillus popilliae ATCC 14706]